MKIALFTFTAALGLGAADAEAGCGSAFCSLNTNWSTQGAWTEPGRRLDLRFEYIDLDQPRNGTHDAEVGESRGITMKCAPSVAISYRPTTTPSMPIGAWL